MKANSISINGIQSDIYKKPKTDGAKSSKSGIWDVKYDSKLDAFENFKVSEFNGNCLMRIVYKNGNLLLEDTFDKIRKRVKY